MQAYYIGKGVLKLLSRSKYSKGWANKNIDPWKPIDQTAINEGWGTVELLGRKYKWNEIVKIAN